MLLVLDHRYFWQTLIYGRGKDHSAHVLTLNGTERNGLVGMVGTFFRSFLPGVSPQFQNHLDRKRLPAVASVHAPWLPLTTQSFAQWSINNLLKTFCCDCHFFHTCCIHGVSKRPFRHSPIAHLPVSCACSCLGSNVHRNLLEFGPREKNTSTVTKAL